MIHRILLLLVLALMVSSIGACSWEPDVAVGSRVPGYAAPDLAGENISLADLKGEVVLLNVWATWCYPCRREMPSFEALHQDFEAEGLRVVAVSIDKASDVGEIHDFLDEYGISFSILHDPQQRFTRTFRTLGVPETFLIDRDGKLVKHWMGRIDGKSESVRGPIREALGSTLASAR